MMDNEQLHNAVDYSLRTARRYLDWLDDVIEGAEQ